MVENLRSCIVEESMRAIYVTVGHYGHVRDQVLANRGVLG